MFECDTPAGRWSQPIVDLDVKDKMVSFKTPIYPHAFEMLQGVDVILRQDNHIIGTIQYFYLATRNLKNNF